MKILDIPPKHLKKNHIKILRTNKKLKNIYINKYLKGGASKKKSTVFFNIYLNNGDMYIIKYTITFTESNNYKVSVQILKDTTISNILKSSQRIDYTKFNIEQNIKKYFEDKYVGFGYFLTLKIFPDNKIPNNTTETLSKEEIDSIIETVSYTSTAFKFGRFL